MTKRIEMEKNLRGARTHKTRSRMREINGVRMSVLCPLMHCQTKKSASITILQHSGRVCNYWNWTWALCQHHKYNQKVVTPFCVSTSRPPFYAIGLCVHTHSECSFFSLRFFVPFLLLLLLYLFIFFINEFDAIDIGIAFIDQWAAHFNSKHITATGWQAALGNKTHIHKWN